MCPLPVTAMGVFLIVVLPVLAGLVTRRRAEGFAKRFEPIARRVSTLLFVLVVAAAILGERDNVVSYMGQAGAVTLVLERRDDELLPFTLAWLFASGLRQRVTITIECGFQNGTLAIAVAMIMFDGGLFVVPAATYSLIMFATALGFVSVARRRVGARDVVLTR